MARSIEHGRKTISQPVPTPVLTGSGSSGPLCLAEESQALCHPEAFDELSTHQVRALYRIKL
jgi:hypothetical protein